MCPLGCTNVRSVPLLQSLDCSRVIPLQCEPGLTCGLLPAVLPNKRPLGSVIVNGCSWYWADHNTVIQSDVLALDLVGGQVKPHGPGTLILLCQVHIECRTPSVCFGCSTDTPDKSLTRSLPTVSGPSYYKTSLVELLTGGVDFLSLNDTEPI